MRHEGLHHLLPGGAARRSVRTPDASTTFARPAVPVWVHARGTGPETGSPLE